MSAGVIQRTLRKHQGRRGGGGGDIREVFCNRPDISRILICHEATYSTKLLQKLNVTLKQLGQTILSQI